VALLAEVTVFVGVIYPVDNVFGAARRRPALIETNCHGGRILLENPDGLSGVDLGDAVRVDDCDVLGTCRGRNGRGCSGGERSRV
jgi:hypothetical protein